MIWCSFYLSDSVRTLKSQIRYNEFQMKLQQTMTTISKRRKKQNVRNGKINKIRYDFNIEYYFVSF